MKFGAMAGRLVGLLWLAVAWAAEPAATKLFPQITDGIHTSDGRLAMRCQVAADGLTVTDAAWDSYQVEGCGKRWTLNMGLPMAEPLKAYRFDAAWAGLPVNLTVEFFNPARPWEVRENYQEILLLGGRPTIGLPDWFHLPTGRLAYDFDEGDWFPSGWSLPAGKLALWQGCAKALQVDRLGECPMYQYGFTHVSPIAMSHGGSAGTRDRRAHLFTDNEWVMAPGEAGYLAKNWKPDAFYHHAANNRITICDFEMCGSHTWGDEQFASFAKIIGDTRAKSPDVLFGCWGQGVLRSSFRIFDSRWEGKPTGVVDLTGARQWREKYNHPADDLNPILARCGLNLGNPSVYWINNSKPSQLYAMLQEWEQGKLARPELTNILSTWIQVEFVDGYPLSPYRFTDAKGRTRVENIKHQVPASATYALSLFGHCVMDGLQCWDIGTRYTEDLADYSDWSTNEPAAKRVIGGTEQNVYYYLKYFGLYNYHVLGMWQASQNKDIIEAATVWEMPEVWTSTGQTWRVGDDRYPSFANYYREPLARVKLSADGGTLLVIAANPYNTGVQAVKLRRPGDAREVELRLVGDYPVIRRYKVRP